LIGSDCHDLTQPIIIVNGLLFIIYVTFLLTNCRSKTEGWLPGWFCGGFVDHINYAPK